ncbi:unnamed protein product [Caenorhabditis bovis]|uniref:Uncharacterized protein n=1 Tax=Caenorhabditis bovis TaxID=2654633 RepID=A0A8S1EA63_9PELO|nr:unnamed protein product [Caenorhabditis bovis]
MTTYKPVWDAPDDIPAQTCNCHYPIGLVIFLIFTIFSLLVCICVCCFDITKCGKRKQSAEAALRKVSIDPRLMDATKFITDRKLSLDPRLLEYSQLLNSSSTSSSSQQSRSIDIPSNLIYSTDTSLVTTV